MDSCIEIVFKNKKPVLFFFSSDIPFLYSLLVILCFQFLRRNDYDTKRFSCTTDVYSLKYSV